MKYLREFDTREEYNAAFEDIPYPNVVLVNDEQKVFYGSPVISTIRINQNLTDPAQIVSGDINGEAIKMIRQHSHRYLGKYTSEGTMSICQLDDSDSTKYVDGTLADLSGTQGDVFMKLPSFGYKAEEVEPNVWDISFCFGGAADSSWKLWEGNELIGVYRASVQNKKLYSISNGAATDLPSFENTKKYVVNRGAGFSLLKWKHRSIMSFLLYALYGNTDCRVSCGKGAKSQHGSGLTNNLGMTDTTPANGDGVMVNFWGLEQWWGGYAEYIDNVIISEEGESNKRWTITEDDGSERNVISAKCEGVYYITKLHIGEHLDAIPIETTDTYVSGAAFVGRETYLSYGILITSGHIPQYYSDMLTMRCKKEATSDGSYDAGRIAFKGKVVKVNNVETFKSLIALS